MADLNGATDPRSAGRLKQMRMAAGMVHRQNPRALPITFGAGLGIMIIVILVAVLLGQWALIPVGVLLGVVVIMTLFARYSQSAQYAMIEGQPGAAAAVLQSMRGGWTVTPAVNANKNMDVVHRAVGKPGVVLVGEGAAGRLATLIANERKKTVRVAHDVPVFEFQVGNDEGQIPVSKLQRQVQKLPRTLKPAAVSDLNFRLKALRPTMQMPKGPLPKGARMPKMPKPR